MKLIVGLGNPGRKYKATRHNVGALLAESFAAERRISIRRRRYSSLVGEGRVEGEETVFMLPLTYMNLSGEAVRSITKDRGIRTVDILILCDDADLEFGSLRLRVRGSDGGHRGLRSVIESLGSSDFARLRIGIGKRGELSSHVLSPFVKDELRELEFILKKAAGAVECWFTKDISECMNAYNSGGGRQAD